MQIKKSIPVCLMGLLACAGESDLADDGRTPIDPDSYGPSIDAPEFAGFLSLDERQEYCANNPDSLACRDIGEALQAWRSAMYHGLPSTTFGQPCYDTNVPEPYGCRFPVQKQVRWFLDSTDCPTDGNSVVTRANFISAATTVPAALFIEGDGNSPVTFTNTTSNATVKFRCADETDRANDSTSLAFTTTANSHTQIDDLPGTPGAAVQYHDANITMFLDRMIDECGAFEAPLVGGYTGVHEMGHALGFAHFTSGLMGPNYPGCGTAVPTQFSNGMATALSIYNGSTSGGVNVIDVSTLTP